MVCNMDQTAGLLGRTCAGDGLAVSKETFPSAFPMTKIAIVEDNEIVLRSLEVFISEDPECRVTHLCGSGEEALRRLPGDPPDIVLMDIHLPGLSGIECTARLRALRPQVQVIMHTVYEETEKIFQALQFGACGYLLKRSTPHQVLAAIHEVRQGGAPMTSEIARKVVAAFQSPVAAVAGPDALSRREREVLGLLARGFANKEIADQLSLSVETIRGHLKLIYEKLHVHSRTEAVLRFMGRTPGAAGGSRP